MGGSGKRNDLRRVVQQRIADLKRENAAESYETIAARCMPPVSTSYVSRIVTGQMPSPSDEKLTALAAGLRMAPEDLWAAKRRLVTEDEEAARVRHIMDAAAYAAQYMSPAELDALNISVGLIYRRLADAHRKELRVLPPVDVDSQNG
jgi:transcriptional regulator with XRE-family HTH domain